MRRPDALAGTQRAAYLATDTPREADIMPILFFILLVVLIAQVGFWNTLGAILGAAAMTVLLIVLLVAIVGLVGMYVARRLLS